MNDVSFSWNDHKAAQNARKHHMPFEEAMSVFLDENAVQIRIISARKATKNETKSYPWAKP